jgi:hypothetical protein
MGDTVNYIIEKLKSFFGMNKIDVPVAMKVNVK